MIRYITDFFRSFLTARIDEAVDQKTRPSRWIQFWIRRFPDLAAYQTEQEELENRLRNELSSYLLLPDLKRTESAFSGTCTDAFSGQASAPVSAPSLSRAFPQQPAKKQRSRLPVVIAAALLLLVVTGGFLFRQNAIFNPSIISTDSGSVAVQSSNISADTVPTGKIFPDSDAPYAGVASPKESFTDESFPGEHFPEWLLIPESHFITLNDVPFPQAAKNGGNANESVANTSVANTSVANAPLANTSVANTSVANAPLAGKSVADQSAANVSASSLPAEKSGAGAILLEIVDSNPLTSYVVNQYLVPVLSNN